MYLLGIDLGTTTCRCAIFDLEGHEVAGAQTATPVTYPAPALAEVAAEAWWRAAAGVVRAALAAGRERGVRPDQLGGVGVTGLMHSPVLLDEAGLPVAPVLLWTDQRSAPQAAALRQETGQRMVNASAPRLRWLREHHPEKLAAARHLLLPKDYLRFRLTGAIATDPSDAGGTGMYDRERGEWRRDLVALTGLVETALPPIRASDALAGTVTATAAAETGLAEGTPVAMGGADAFVTRLGAGPFAPGEVCLYLGTATWIAIASKDPATAETRLAGLGANTATGAALRWLRDVLGTDGGDTAVGGEERLAELEPAQAAATFAGLTRLAEGVPAGAEGLFFLPHLMGERGPTEEPDARGAFVGLSLRHGRGHLVRAVLEGTAFQVRRVLDHGLQARREAARSEIAIPTAGVACGGGTRSALWMEILAAVTGLELRVPEVVEAGALGAAMLAGAAAGLLNLKTAPERLTRPAAQYAPRPELVEAYRVLYKRYCALDDLLLRWFKGGRET